MRVHPSCPTRPVTGIPVPNSKRTGLCLKVLSTFTASNLNGERLCRLTWLACLGRRNFLKLALCSRDWGWSVGPRGDTITRFDSCGRLRTFRLGHDCLDILREWLLLFHRRRAVAACGRTRKSLHRMGVGLAQGMDLPGPDPGTFIRAAGHRAVWRKHSDRMHQRAALASAGSYWHYRKMSQADFTCLCGLRALSRAHLSFCCSRLPTTRVQERLMAVEAEEVPPPPPVLDLEGLVDECCESLPPLQGCVIAATDGSSKDLIAAAAIHLPQHGFLKACGLPGEDQCSYRAELFALWLLFQVISGVVLSDVSEIHVFNDSESAVTAIQATPDCQQRLAFSGLLYEICASIVVIRRAGVIVQLHWLPSHGKTPAHWRPWSGLDEAAQRAINAATDRAAQLECQRRSHRRKCLDCTVEFCMVAELRLWNQGRSEKEWTSE